MVTDNGTPALADDETITVTVREVNRAPILAAIGAKQVDEGTELTFSATATDPDRPANTLAFSLGAGAPTGASIDATSGVFRWTPTESQGPGDYQVKIVVTDNGTPALADDETITVTVRQSATGWTFALTLTGADKAGLGFGMAPGASDGYDDALDLDSPEAPGPGNAKGGAYFVDANDFLYARDIRAPAATAEWLLEVVANANPVVISWVAGQVPTGKSLALQQVTAADADTLVPATWHDLNLAGAVEVPAETSQWFLIRLPGYAEATLGLARGWNLVSLPIAPADPAVAAVFDTVPGRGDAGGPAETLRDGRRGSVIAGSVWGWDAANRRYAAVETVTALAGYWVYAPAAATVTVRGQPVVADLALLAGWNLIGSAAAAAVPTDNRLQGHCWQWDPKLQEYVVPEALTPGLGYWLYAREAFVIGFGTTR